MGKEEESHTSKTSDESDDASSTSSASSSSSSSSSNSSNSSKSSSSSSSSSSSNSSTSTSSFTTTSSYRCRHAHLDKDWCPGTQKLREICRTIVIEQDSPEYSEEIAEEIIKKMKGIHFFRSFKSEKQDDSSDSDSDSDDGEFGLKGEYGFGCYTEEDGVETYDYDDVGKIDKRDLEEILEPFYEGELYLVENEAHPRDVYFKHPNHSGTQAFVRASQYVVATRGVKRCYNREAYHMMKKLLYDSKFYVGKAPNCEKATKDDLFLIFEARYEFDRKMMRRVIRTNKRPRPIPGTQILKCCNRKYKEDKIHWIVKLFQCLPTLLAIPLLIVISLVFFGLLYFIIWYIFKVIITTIYVILGVSISYLIGSGSGGDEPELTEGEAVQEVVDEYIQETIGDVVTRFRNLRG